MNRRLKNLLISLLIIAYILVYRFFIYTNFLAYNEFITASFTIVLFTISLVVYGYRKIINNYINKKIIKNSIIFIFLYFLFSYGIGLVTGFLKSGYSLKFLSIIDNIFPVVIIIICSELFRYIFIRANKDRKFGIFIITFLLIVLEVNLEIRYDSFASTEQIFKFSTEIILPIIMKNIMCSYLYYQNDYRSGLTYRLILDTYTYYVPIEPNLSEYLKSIINLVFPFLLLVRSMRITDDYYYTTTSNKKNSLATDILAFIFIIVVVLMIIGVGPVKILGIETPSMTPNIKVGDAVVIFKGANKDKLKENDIVAYKNKDGVIVVHRIINVNSDGTFITKGDYNNTADPEYVSKDQVVGKIVLKIPYIAYPAIVFRGGK